MKNGCECFDKLSMHGFSSGNSSSGPLVLSLSKDSERVFQQPANPPAGDFRPIAGEVTMFRSLCWSLSLLFVLGIGASAGRAEDRVRVGWAAMTASHTPLWVAQEKGMLARQGLLAEPIFFGAGPPAMQALIAGDLDIVVTSAPNVVNPRLGGADTVMVLSIIPTFIDHIISAPSITNPEQLKGKIGSVNRFGSISDMGLRLALRKLGIDPERDVQIVPAGGNPERLAAISKGISQFTIMNEPFIKEAERLGFRDLVNMATLKIPLHGNGLVTRESIIKARRPVVTKFARAVTEAIHFIKADKEATKAVIGKYTKLKDPEGLERTYRNYTAVLMDVPYPDPAGIKTLLDDMAPRNAKAAAADPRIFVDQSFVQEMETSGFIKQLNR
jgi:NitT/TauT family transport system substrate-binding protein